MSETPAVELREAIVARLGEARAAHPEIALADEDFVAHVGDKLQADPTATIEALRTTELFVARAAASRDPAALRVLERDCFGEIDAAYRKFPGVGLELDDVRQRLREQLVLREAPSILGYAGRGPLASWVRAAALHLLVNIVRREQREEATDAELFDVVIGSEPSAEAAYVKLTCRAELEAALGSAMSSLDDRERALLRHAFVDRRNVDEIGAVYGIHRATAARWIAAARVKLVARTQNDLSERLGVSEREARSIIAAALSGVGSQLLATLR